MTGTVLTAAAVVADGQVHRPGWLQVIGDRIGAAGGGPAPRAADVDLGDQTVVPGFVDIHCHGGGGGAFTVGSEDEALRAARFHRARGTTTMLASLVTASPEDLQTGVKVLAGLADAGEIAGIHLEGPWLSDRRAGAHPKALLRDPDRGEIADVLAAGRGHVRMVTLAPERPGGLDAIRQVLDHGAVAAIGHTDATYAITRAALAAGASVATHLYNAMRPPHHREPGPVVALIEDPDAVLGAGAGRRPPASRGLPPGAGRRRSRADRPGHRCDGRGWDAGRGVPARFGGCDRDQRHRPGPRHRHHRR